MTLVGLAKAQGPDTTNSRLNPILKSSRAFPAKVASAFLDNTGI
jgi:hypothetical protein